MVAASKRLSPQQRVERARKASAAAHSPERYATKLVDQVSGVSTETLHKLCTAVHAELESREN